MDWGEFEAFNVDLRIFWADIFYLQYRLEDIEYRSEAPNTDETWSNQKEISLKRQANGGTQCRAIIVGAASGLPVVIGPE